MVGLTDVVKKNEKKFGKGTMYKGTDCGDDFYRIPTGIFAVDYMLGGGFPIGVTSCIYGPPGGGKTLVMTRLACGAQQICWRCYNYHWDCSCEEEPYRQKVAIIQVEMFDMGWAVQLGLDPELVYIVEPDSGEQASDIIVDCVKADDCGCVILDSLPMLVPTAEIESSALDGKMGLQARLIGELIRKVKAALIKEKKRNHPVSFITTNQVRAKIGGFGFGPQEEQPGGYASKHDWHVTIRMSQLKSTNIDKNTELPIDAHFKASMIAMGNKRKVFTLSGASEFWVTVADTGEYLKGTINDYKTALQYAENAALIGRDPWSFMGKTYKTKQEMLDTWLDTPTFLSAKKFIVDSYIATVKNASNECPTPAPTEEAGSQEE